MSIYSRFGPPKRKKPVFVNGGAVYIKTKAELESAIKSAVSIKYPQMLRRR